MFFIIPPRVIESEERTGVFGDIEDFVTNYVDSGKNRRDWREQINSRDRELPELLKEQNLSWQHIVRDASKQDEASSGANNDYEASRPKRYARPSKALQRASAAIDRWYKPPGRVRNLSL